MLIKRIRAHPDLSNYICDSCEENGVSLDLCDELNPDEVVIIKVDKYYNEIKEGTRLASPDCLIIQRCVNNGYGLTIVELKSITSSSGFTVDNLINKFTNCIDDFICNKFKDYLDRDYISVSLYFITNIEIYKRDRGLKLEVLLNKPIKFRTKKYLIRFGKQSLTLRNCYS